MKQRSLVVNVSLRPRRMHLVTHERYKVRLVAKKFIQNNGIDCIKYLSPLSKKYYLHVILTLIAHFDLELHKINVKKHFLTMI